MRILQCGKEDMYDIRETKRKTIRTYKLGKSEFYYGREQEQRNKELGQNERNWTRGNGQKKCMCVRACKLNCMHYMQFTIQYKVMKHLEVYWYIYILKQTRPKCNLLDIIYSPANIVIYNLSYGYVFRLISFSVIQRFWHF